MLYTLSNDTLCVKISDHGAELQSVVSKKDGCEYIWQGDAKYWGDRSPVLFPFCGRCLDGKYTYAGKEYAIKSHGFASAHDYKVTQVSDTCAKFLLTDNEETRKCYPFAFAFEMTYMLEGNTLRVGVEIRNNGEEMLPATFGGHPGFNVPFVAGNCFEDHYLRFGEKCCPNQLGITPEGYFSGITEALYLENGDTLHLDHEFFAIDGIFMNRISDRITLGCDTDTHAVDLYFPGFPYLGIWQEYSKDTPFLCIEPWCGLPAYAGVPDVLERKNDLFRIPAGEVKNVSYTMTFR
jgi:galactose mutarotase-like enzyme